MRAKVAAEQLWYYSSSQIPGHDSSHAHCCGCQKSWTPWAHGSGSSLCDYRREFLNSEGRPVKLLDEGRPIGELL
jgi:hypothetical protein